MPLTVRPARVPYLAHSHCVEARLLSALDVALTIAGADRCGVLWRDRLGAGHTASVGSGEALELAATLLDATDEPADDLDGAWIMPLLDARGERFGVLVLDVPADEARARAVQAAAEHIALLLDSSRHDADRTAAYEALIEVSSQIHAQELNTDEILALIVRQARQLMEVDVTWLALIDEHEQRVVVKVASGATTDDFVRMWVQVGKGVGGLAVRDRRPVVVRDHRTYEHPTTELVTRTLAAEGVVSLLAVPMIFDARPVGALYGGSRTPTDFTETAVSVFTALAGQAAVSIANSRLYRDLASKKDTLERTFALHEMLNQAALGGGGMDSIGRQLAGIVGCDVVVVRAGGTPRARSYSSDPEHADPVDLPAGAGDPTAQDARSVPIVAGEEELGTIRACEGGELTDLQRSALQQGATVMALEMMKERAALEAEWRLRGELLEEILQADGSWSDGLLLRSERLGVDLDEERCLVVIEPFESHEARDLQFVVRATFHRDLGDGTALLATRGERVLVALAQAPEAAAAAVRLLVEKAEKSGVPAVAGLSTLRRNLAVALREAGAAVGLARKAGAGRIVTHESLGSLRFLLDAPDTGQMVEMVRDLLGPVAAHDRKRGGGGILETLRAYLAVGGNRSAVADQCHIHVSTVKYRMRKASELLDMPLSDARARFELTLAFDVLDVLAMLGIDAFGIAST